MWEYLTKPEISGAVMAIVAVLTLGGVFLSWFFGLWGSRKTSGKYVAKNGSVIVEGDVHGDVTTNSKSDKK